MNPQGLRRLINAIIIQACDDYKRAFNGTYVDANHRSNSEVLLETEQFFLSDYFTDMCNLDPYWLMEELKRNSHNKKVYIKGHQT